MHWIRGNDREPERHSSPKNGSAPHMCPISHDCVSWPNYIHVPKARRVKWATLAQLFFVKIQHFPKVPFVSKDPQSSANCSKTSYRENTTIMLFSLVFVKVPKKQFSLDFSPTRNFWLNKNHVLCRESWLNLSTSTSLHLSPRVV